MEKISIIVTCCNEKELLRRAVASIEAQTDKDFEVVIVNDAATDTTTNSICRELEGQKRTCVVWHQKQGGLSAARNSGYMAAENDICVWLDADDVLPPGAIAAIREGFKQSPESDFVFGNYIKRDIEEGTERVVDCSHLCSSDGFLDPRQMARKKGIFLGVSPCRKSAWERIGGYKERFSYDVQDVDFWMRMLLSGAKGIYVDHVIYEWNKSKSGMNAKTSIGRWAHLSETNIAFYETFSDISEEKHQIFKDYMSAGDFVSAKRMARQLLSLCPMSLPIVVVAIFPPTLARLIYQINGAFVRLLDHKSQQ